MLMSIVATATQPAANASPSLVWIQLGMLLTTVALVVIAALQLRSARALFREQREIEGADRRRETFEELYLSFRDFTNPRDAVSFNDHLQAAESRWREASREVFRIAGDDDKLSEVIRDVDAIMFASARATKRVTFTLDEDIENQRTLGKLGDALRTRGIPIPDEHAAAVRRAGTSPEPRPGEAEEGPTDDPD